MSAQKAVKNMRPDPPDFRDRMYSPTLDALKSKFNPKPFDDPVWTARVRNQEDTSACTGFALAAMVEALAYKRKTVSSRPDVAALKFSPFMLYYFARRYDEFGHDNEDSGSTARASMKAWHKHEACKMTHWPKLNDKPSTANEKWVSDAFKTPLGAYYRVDHQSISDLHAAISTTGVVYVTAETHSGWETPDENGRIRNVREEPSGEGHAFLLVGYDEHGFWIQNSWGSEWGLNGFAHLDYTDWREHGWDAWIGQIGVYITSHLNSLGCGLQIERAAETTPASKDRDPLRAARSLLSANPVVQAQQINPYIVNLENNGVLSNSGVFRTSPRDLEDLVNFYLPEAIKDWKLSDNDPVDVALYAHGGLVPENSAGETAATWISALYARKIFPVFFMWETGLLNTIGNIFRDLLGRGRAAGEGSLSRLLETSADRFLDFKDDRLEGLVAPASTPIWDEIKENSALASNNPNGGLSILARLLREADQALVKRLRFHLVGHSAGAVFHAHLLPKLIGLGLKVQGVHFMAPACRIDLFQENILPHFQAGQIPVFTQFHMDDLFEQADNCLGIYNRSLLYLVSNACERRRGTPLLGMERFVREAAWKDNPNPREITAWEFISSPTSPLPQDPLKRSIATAHGAFDNDPHTIRSILERIKN